jgi:carbamoyltransferase
MIVLGISAFYHDAAAAIIKNGEIIAAAQEERFTRKKHDPDFPANAIRFCLKQAKVNLSQVDHVVFYDKPFIKFERLLETYLAFAPKGFLSFLKAIPLWIKEKLFQKRMILEDLRKISPQFDAKKLLFSEHHLSHAASAFFPSPFEKAAVLTMDGVGEWTTTSLAIGDKNNLTIKQEIAFPHSLGLLYSAFTYYAGFKVNSGEYKLMGLAPYGKPIYADLIKNKLIDVKPDGSFRLRMQYFNYPVGLNMTSSLFHKLFKGPPRRPESLITQKEMDLAASIQKVIEEIVIKIAKNIRKETGLENLCLAGGVALNCVANGKLIDEKIFKNIWIQPASGDAGGALGAALAVNYMMYKQKRVIRKNDAMSGSYLGTEFSQPEIEQKLKKAGAVYKTYSKTEMVKKSAELLASGLALGWVNGRMEFGPRSLGARSILADPRSEKMQKNLNLKVKFRESFRPFAPSVLSENASQWFEIKNDSPYMLKVAPVKKSKQVKTKQNKKLFGIDQLNLKRSSIPAVTHVDYSARVQTVHKETNPVFHELITAFYKKTKCPVLVNTSFNIRGEPIVNSPEDAFRCFMGCDLDVLVVGNSILLKTEQKQLKNQDYKDLYELD